MKHYCITNVTIFDNCDACKAWDKCDRKCYMASKMKCIAQGSGGFKEKGPGGKRSEGPILGGKMKR